MLGFIGPVTLLAVPVQQQRVITALVCHGVQASQHMCTIAAVIVSAAPAPQKEAHLKVGPSGATTPTCIP
jgi:hypothetical protein